MKTYCIIISFLVISFLSLVGCTKESPLNTSTANVAAPQPTTFSSTGFGNGSTFYDLMDSRDLVVPVDYYNSGFAQQLLCYRPGVGSCWILNNTAAVGATPSYVPIFQSSNGIATSPYRYDLSDSRDKVLPYDLEGTGKLKT